MQDSKEPNTPRRAPAAGGYSRGGRTRLRILHAALKVFGNRGYAGASTRRIAAEARMTPPAVQYYFESKENLHRACAQYILDRLDKKLSTALRSAERVLAEHNSNEAGEALCSVLDALNHASLASSDSPVWQRFSAQAQMEIDSPGGQLIHTQMVNPIFEICARLIACATMSPLDERLYVKSLAIVNQRLAFCGDVALARSAEVQWSSERQHLAVIRSVLRENTLLMLQTKLA